MTVAPAEYGRNFRGAWRARKQTGSTREEERLEYHERLEKMRRVSEEIRGLQQILRPIAEGRTTLDRAADHIERVVPRVTNALEKIDPRKPGEAEAVAQARIQWEIARVSPVLARPHDALGADVLLPEVAHVLDHTDEMLFVLARVTVPPRVKRWLSGTVPHHYVPFHDVFEDELPRRDQRERLLHYMAHNAAGLDNGIISPNAGLIYRHSGGHVLRSWATVLLLAALAGAIGFLLLHGSVPFVGWELAFLLPRDPAGQATLYLLPWLGILGGVAIHAIVEAEKRSLNKGRPPLFSFALFPRWIDALAGVIIYRGLLSLVALVGMFAFPADAATPLTAFFVGYSLDSFVGLFGERWGGMSEKKVEAWRKKAASE